MILNSSGRYKTNYDCTNIRILLENFRWCVSKKIKMKSSFMYVFLEFHICVAEHSFPGKVLRFCRFVSPHFIVSTGFTPELPEGIAAQIFS
jgi:hypothetical protein